MPCISPISIPDVGLAKFHTRAYLKVPCGHCVGCSRDRINAWFVRLYSEFHMRDMVGLPSYFVTITIDPSLWPGLTKDTPGVADRVSPFLRSWSERVRYICGRSIRRFFCSEYGSCGEVYRDSKGVVRITTGALHFHGFIFSDVDMEMLQSELRSTHGYMWYVRMTDTRMVRYAVSYATKDYSESDPRLRARTFVSPGLGCHYFYFGNGAPTSHVLINGFHYMTPRYFFYRYYGYDKYTMDNTLNRYATYLDQLRVAKNELCNFSQTSLLHVATKRGAPVLAWNELVPLVDLHQVSVQHPTFRRHVLATLQEASYSDMLSNPDLTFEPYFEISGHSFHPPEFTQLCINFQYQYERN